MIDFQIVTGKYRDTFGVWFDDGTLDSRDIFLHYRLNCNLKIYIQDYWEYNDNKLEEIINAFSRDVV